MKTNGLSSLRQRYWGGAGPILTKIHLRKCLVGGGDRTHEYKIKKLNAVIQMI